MQSYDPVLCPLLREFFKAELEFWNSPDAITQSYGHGCVVGLIVAIQVVSGRRFIGPILPMGGRKL